MEDIKVLIENYEKMYKVMGIHKEQNTIEKNEDWQVYLGSLLRDGKISQEFYNEYQWQYYPEDQEKPQPLNEKEKIEFAKLQEHFKQLNKNSMEASPKEVREKTEDIIIDNN